MIATLGLFSFCTQARYVSVEASCLVSEWVRRVLRTRKDVAGYNIVISGSAARVE
jgi:hypothetical protein